MTEKKEPTQQEKVDHLMKTFNFKVSPVTKASVEACLRAIAEPGCLVRVTFTHFGQVRETCSVTEQVLSGLGKYDFNKTAKNLLVGKLVYELTNGSGIEFVSDHNSMLKNIAETAKKIAAEGRPA